MESNFTIQKISMTVKATREGLVGQKTASGYIIDKVVSFVALPSRHALGQFVMLTNPLTGITTYAQVLDVGPWNTDDEEYVFTGKRPKAEAGKSLSKKGTNGAGIDLGEKVWNTLGMKDNGEVTWEFLI